MNVSQWHIEDIVMTAILGGLWLWLANLTPNQLFIPENDSLSSFPYKNTGMSGGMNLTIVTVVPIVVYLIIYFIAKYAKNPKYIRDFDIIEVICCHLCSITFAGDICHVLKTYIGRARPDYYSFANDILSGSIDMDKSIENDREKQELKKEAFKSFPSGHSCTSASGCLFFSLSLIGIIEHNRAWSITLKLLPLAYAFYIGSMRIREYRHHTDDVVAGFLIGFLISIIFYIASYSSVYRGINP